jgi:Esterase/lipase
MKYKLWENGTPYYNAQYMQPEPTLIPYLLNNDKTNSVVIVFPGGGYSQHTKHECEPIAKRLNEAGLSAFVLNYRLRPYHHPAILTDALRAIQYVRFHAEQFHIDPEKIGIIGFSAGGHLASTVIGQYNLGTDNGDEIDRVSSRPNACALCYAVILLGDERHQGSKINLLGENPDAALVKFLSGENNIREDCPPVFLWHTAEDSVVHVDNSLRMALALKEKKIPFELHVFPYGYHGLGLSNDNEHVKQWFPLLINWLNLNEFL